MNGRRRLARIALSAAAVGLAACVDPDPATQVMATIDLVGTPIGGLGRVDVAIRSGSTAEPPSAWEQVYTVRHGVDALPVHIAIVPRDDDATRVYEVTATASAPGLQGVLSSRVRSGFIAGRTLALRIVLDPRCASSDPDDYGCDAVVAPGSLPDWTGSSTGDAGVDLRRDGGRLGGDGGTEGCRNDDDCAVNDDLHVCLRDACVEGECVLEPFDGPCDDGDACTKEDVCEADRCMGVPVVCAGTGSVCDPSSGACGCAEGHLACPTGCLRGATCCPGSTMGACEGCGVRTCNGAGDGYACIFPSHVSTPPACTNPGGTYCSGVDPTCGCLPGQRRNCNDNCSIGGCFP